MASTLPDEPRVENQPLAEWFYTQRGETYGPVSSAELRAAAHLGFLGPGDFVRRTDHAHWTAAYSIPGLFKEAG
jgi:hypothetical protein